MIIIVSLTKSINNLNIRSSPKTRNERIYQNVDVVEKAIKRTNLVV